MAKSGFGGVAGGESVNGKWRCLWHSLKQFCSPFAGCLAKGGLEILYEVGRCPSEARWLCAVITLQMRVQHKTDVHCLQTMNIGFMLNVLRQQIKGPNKFLYQKVISLWYNSCH